MIQNIDYFQFIRIQKNRCEMRGVKFTKKHAHKCKDAFIAKVIRKYGFNAGFKAYYYPKTMDKYFRSRSDRLLILDRVKRDMAIFTKFPVP